MRMCQMQVDRLAKENLNIQQPTIPCTNEDILVQNEELKDMLKQNAEDFKSLLNQLETLRSSLAEKARLNEDLNK